MITKKNILIFLILITVSAFTFSQSETLKENNQPYIDSGNTAWVLISSALVLFMTAPALALFYGGLVKKKNVLNILMQCLMTLAIISVLWVTVGYTLAFSPGKGILSGFIGDFSWIFLKNININDPSPYFISQESARIPHLVYVIFQGMFAVITPALIIGAFAERIKFSSYLAFIIAWFFLVYIPVAHWVWSSNGWLFKMGALDFAGGTVVHINAGIASLITAIMIGKRENLKPTPPHNLIFTFTGAAMLWFGWFGFNAGSALAADGLAANAFIVTNVAAATAAITWAILDWIFHKSPTILGAATGAVAGLVAITPAAGFVNIESAIIIGLVVSIICYFMVVVVKNKFGYDDALDAFGVHGIGGIWGALATGIFATNTIQSGYSGLLNGNPKQLLIQVIATIVTLTYSAIVTFAVFKIIDLMMKVRVSYNDEAVGLDVSQHSERGTTIIE